jgi:hypothetical protein
MTNSLPWDGCSSKNLFETRDETATVICDMRTEIAARKISFGIASHLILRQRINGLHAVGQLGVQSFDLDGVAPAVGDAHGQTSYRL